MLKKSWLVTVSLAVLVAAIAANAKTVLAFCGFFVAKVDAEMFNNRSEVAIAHHNNLTTYSLAFDYKGEPKDFALVLPVPVVLKKEDVRVIEANLFQRLDDFTAPRLVRYEPRSFRRDGNAIPEAAEAPVPSSAPVQVLERFTVGEYDVVILSASESNALETWLRQNQYKIPRGAAGYFRPYIERELYFFVVRVNLEEREKLGFQDLRPIQFAVSDSAAQRRCAAGGLPQGECSEIMLPFQLGKINSEGEQSVIVYFLSDRGRTEAKNYTNVMIPSNFNVPVEIESQFGQFYKDLLQATIKATGRETVVTEYAWDTASCDPCSTIPLNPQELKELGMNRNTAFITRMYMQYTKETYNKDLIFRLTEDKRTYQGRYILTPKEALDSKDISGAEVRAPYGKLLSNFSLTALFEEHQE